MSRVHNRVVLGESELETCLPNHKLKHEEIAWRTKTVIINIQVIMQPTLWPAV